MGQQRYPYLDRSCSTLRTHSYFSFRNWIRSICYSVKGNSFDLLLKGLRRFYYIYTLRKEIFTSLSLSLLQSRFLESRDQIFSNCLRFKKRKKEKKKRKNSLLFSFGEVISPTWEAPVSSLDYAGNRNTAWTILKCIVHWHKTLLRSCVRACTFTEIKTEFPSNDVGEGKREKERFELETRVRISFVTLYPTYYISSNVVS